MKKKLQKYFGILLVVTMIVSLYANDGITAKASTDTTELTEITEVNLLNVPFTYTLGQTVQNYTYSDPDSRYGATGTWYKYDYEDSAWEPVDSPDTFDKGVYSFKLDVRPANGYTFSYDTNLMVDGTTWYDGWYISYDENSNSYMMGVEKYVSLGTPITDIQDLTSAFKEPEIGDTFDGEFTIEVPESCPYLVTGIWSDEDGNASGTFTQGKKYELNMEVTAKEGYYFEEGFRILLGDNKVEFNGWDKVIVFGFYMKSFKTQINAVEISVPKAEVGGTLQIGEFEIPVSSDAPYTVKGIWYDEDGEVITTEAVEDGKAYTLKVTMEPVDGYEFQDSLLVTVNGVTMKADLYEEDKAMVEVSYSFRESINRIELTGLSQPTVGEALFSTSTLQVPSDAKYSVDSVVMHNVKTGDLETVYQDGQIYDVMIVVKADEGYEFAADTSCFLDGERIESWVRGDEVYLFIQYSFATVISEVWMSNLPTMEVGQIATTDVTVPDNAPYEILCHWLLWDDFYEAYGLFEGVFEADKVYQLDVEIIVKDGYCFDEENTIFYVDNNPVDVEQNYLESATYSKEYAEGLQVIDRVEITVDAPVMGNHASVGPDVSISQGANYKVDDSWSSWIIGTPEVWSSYDDIFKSGSSYGMKLSIVADEGYVFAEDMTIVINGVVIDDLQNYSIGRKLADVVYFFESTCAHDYTAWEVGADGAYYRTCNICGKKDLCTHNYTAWEVGADGTYYRTCTSCGNKETCTHSYSAWEVGADGTYYRTCTSCGNKETCTHSYSAWEVGADGTYYRTCTSCGNKETCTHTYDNDVDTTCNVCGQIRSPKTGDYNSFSIWMALIALSGMTIIGTKMYQKKE